jgi:hypothetical protein
MPNPYPALDPNYFTGASNTVTAQDQSTGSSLNSLLDTITVAATRINTAVGDVASAAEQWAELALITSRGWAVNQYLRTFTMRNTAHLLGKYSLVATVGLDIVDPNKSALATMRDAGVGIVGFSTGPVGAIGAGVYFSIDGFYPGGIENYAADYLSACSESGC